MYYGIEFWVMEPSVEEDNSTDSRRRKRSTDDTGEDFGHLNVWFSMTTLSSQCRYWDPNDNAWATDGCEVRMCTA